MGLEFDLRGFVNRLRNYQLVTGLLNEWYSEEVEKRKNVPHIFLKNVCHLYSFLCTTYIGFICKIEDGLCYGRCLFKYILKNV